MSKNLDTLKEAWEYQFSKSDPGEYGPQPNFRGVPTLKPAFVTTVEALEAYYTEDESPGYGQTAWNKDFGVDAPFDRCVGYFDSEVTDYNFYVKKGKVVRFNSTGSTIATRYIPLSDFPLPIAFHWSYPESAYTTSTILFIYEISQSNFTTPVKNRNLILDSVSQLYGSSILIIPDDNNELEVYTFDFKGSPNTIDWALSSLASTLQAGQYYGNSLLKPGSAIYRTWNYTTPGIYLILPVVVGPSLDTFTGDNVCYWDTSEKSVIHTATAVLVGYAPYTTEANNKNLGWAYWIGGSQANTFSRLYVHREVRITSNTVVFRLA